MTQPTHSFLASVEKTKQHFEQVLTQQIEQADIADAKLKDAMAYSLLLGGKRIRPFLIYATGKLFNAEQQDLDIAACAIEAIHTYSLIHDDLPAMDDDDLRRGKKTCHKQFDEATAILAGDTLQSFAFELLATQNSSSLRSAQTLKLISALSSAATKMCAGQSIDLQQTNSIDNTTDSAVALEQLANMHKLKTGALIEAAVLMGAICGNASGNELKKLREYASAIGLAFQVWDDVLDIISDTDTLGKPQGSDEEANKLTYPAILGLDQAKQKAYDLVARATQALEDMPNDTQLLTQLAQYIVERDH